jgi:putative membrane protein
VAFAAEYSSTHNGFPFGHYAYTGDTHGDEVYLSNIPAFVPVAYAVMIYAGRSIAVFLTRSRVALVFLGAVATVAVDLIVDPVAVRGSQWFLGDLFHYASHGQWFGVPLTNFGGWVLVAALVIGLDELLGRSEAIRPSRRGILLAAGVIAFNLVLAFAIGATLVGFAGLGVAGIIALGLAGRTLEAS